MMNQTFCRLRTFGVATVLFGALVFSGASIRKADANTSDQLEARCGWFSNPTPGNISLYDRDAEWIIGVQGGYQVEGDWDWPVFKAGQWVRTNAGSYGYGCACLRVRVDHQTSRVLEIKSASGKTLAACRKDPALQKWKSSLE